MTYESLATLIEPYADGPFDDFFVDSQDANSGLHMGYYGVKHVHQPFINGLHGTLPQSL